MDKILFLSYYWPPSGGPGVQRALKFAKFLPDHKIDPYVVTVKANKASYPLIDSTLEKDVADDLKVFRTNSFEPLEWYRIFTKKKEIPYSGFVNMDKSTLFQKIARFIRGNFFIPDARMGWMRYAYKKAFQLSKENNFKAIVSTSPPHSTQLTGLKLKFNTGLPWIADMRDPWTDIYYYNDFYHLPFAKRKDAAYELQVLESADRIIVTNHSAKDLFLSKSEKINPDKIVVIPNGFDKKDFIKRYTPPKKEMIITYSGTIADSYCIEEFISALAQFHKQQPDFPLKIRFVGKVSAGIKKQIRKLSLREITEYIGYVSHDKAIKYLLKSSLLFMASPKIVNNESIVPGKLFEYLAALKPIIFIGPVKCDVARMIHECKAGRSFNYEEGFRMLNYITELAERWKKAPDLDIKNDYYKKYSRQELTKTFAKIIKEL